MRARVLGRVFVVMTCAGASTWVAACVGDDPATGTLPFDASPGPDATSPSGDSGSQTDAGGSGDATTAGDAGPDATFCDTKSKSASVADFFCADFDEGPVESGWSRIERAGNEGILEATTQFFASSPRGLLAEAPTSAATTTRGAWLEWTASGAAKIKSVTVDVKVNPDINANAYMMQTGYVELVSVDFANGNVSVRYTDGRFVQDSEYTGYYLYGYYNGAGVIEQHMRLASSPQRNAWTTLRLFVTFPTTGSNGIASVHYNGVQIGQNLTVPTEISTSIDVRVGAKAAGAVARPTPHRYDDVIAEIVRE